MQQGVLDDYLQQLHDEGELDSSGQITLDPTKAREKLATSRFLHAAEGMLAVVGAALLARSSWVRIARNRNRIVVLSSAGLETSADLRELFSAMFSGTQPAAAKELALALNSLYPKHCQALTVEVQLGEELWMGEFRGSEWVAQPLMPPADWPAHVVQRITLVRPPAWRRPWEWLQTRLRGLDDLNVLRRRTRWSPVPVEFQAGQEFKSSWELDPPEFPTPALASLSVESQNSVLALPDYLQRPVGLFHWSIRSRARTSLRGALLAGPGDLSTVTIVYRGLTMARHQFASRKLPFEGVLNTEVLDLDASRQQIVNNNRLWNLTGQLRIWISQALAAWLLQLQDDDLDGELRSRLLTLSAGLQAQKKDAEVFQALGHLRIYPVARANEVSYLSWRELDELVQRYGGLHWRAAHKEAVWVHGRPVVPAWRQEWATLIRRMNWKRVDSTRILNRFQSLAPRLEEARRSSLLEFSLRLEHDLKGRLFLPASFGLSLLQIDWGGQPYDSLDEPLFRHFPPSLMVFVDGEFCWSFEEATKQILHLVRTAVWEQAGELLRAFVEAGIRHPEHFCSLVRLWQTQHQKRQRLLADLPSEVLSYRFYSELFSEITLATMMESSEEWSARVPDELKTPISWLKRES